MTKRIMIALCFLMNTSGAIASVTKSFAYFDDYGDDDEDNQTSQRDQRDGESESDDRDQSFSPPLSESHEEIEEPQNYPYVLKIIAKNIHHKVASSFLLEGTQMTILSDEQEPVKPETIAFLKKNGVMKTDHVPQDWSAQVVNLYPDKMPKPMAQLAMGKFVLFYGDSVRVGDVVSCAHMLEISGPKDAWRVSDKRFYMAWGPYGAFLDYHRFVEPRELERQQKEEDKREDERNKRRKSKKKRSGQEDDIYDPFSPAYDPFAGSDYQ